jgi:hypothetical protein
VDFESLSRRAAQNAIDDGVKSPVCFSERRYKMDDYFCSMVYHQYKALATFPSLTEQEMVHLINIDSQGSVGKQVASVLDDLQRRNHTVDAIFTFSEYIFDSINMVRV